nr:VOC family protein [Pseudoxanthomonas sp.]
MVRLDHLILRVRSIPVSVSFYREVLGFPHEGRQGPFDVLRIGADSVIDLLQAEPRDPAHLAFHMDPLRFEQTLERLRAAGIAFGGDPFSRDGRIRPQFGAGGWADALYFHDPDHHNLEIRTHDPR